MILSRIFLTIAVLFLAAASSAQAPDAKPVERTLVLESIAVEGNTRTPRDVVLRHLPLAEGSPVEPDAILDALDDLRARDLFASLDFRTEPGTTRGRVKLVLVVEEKHVEFRFGTGYRDLDGWYLIPAELRFDNRLGRGEQLRLTSKIGYRLAGLELAFRELHAGANGDLFWGLDAGGFGLDHVYFVDGVEYSHHLGRGHLGAHLGRRFGRWTLELGGRAETVDADSVPEAREDDELRGIERGDSIAFADLPPDIQRAVGETKGQVLHAEMTHDARSDRLVAGTPSRGFWGSVRAEGRLRDETSIAMITTDLRAYRRVHNLSIAMRVRGGVAGNDARFYDRFHLGGLYTVRGFPSQSLSPSEGDTRFWTSTLEIRGALVGRTDRPRLAGLAFIDAGQGWQRDVDLADAHVAAGFGLRLRVPWFEWFGVDAGIPITDSPVGESFHANAALGWNF